MPYRKIDYCRQYWCTSKVGIDLSSWKKPCSLSGKWCKRSSTECRRIESSSSKGIGKSCSRNKASSLPSVVRGYRSSETRDDKCPYSIIE